MLSSHKHTIAYRPEIDGLRAIAVIPVILFHADFKSFSGGFVGVDVFFVISGFLITSIIVKDLSQNRFSLINFYERRARRILPALFAVSVTCIPFAWVWMTPDDLDRFGRSLISVATFSSNIFFWKNTGYFAPAASENPLLHTWSLAVEEQFYLFFPIILWSLWRFGKRTLLVILAAIFVASLGMSEWGARFHPTANFYLFPTRAWELMVGGLVALTYSKRPTGNGDNRFYSLIALVGLILILGAVFFFDDTVPFPSLYALIPTLGTALILKYGSRSGLCGKLLSSRPLVSIGLISYSAYLWHQPFFAFTESLYTVAPPTWLMLLLSVLALVIGWFSWRFIEYPFREKKHTSPEFIWRMSGVSLLSIILIGLAIQLSNGFPERMPTSYVAGQWDMRLGPNYGLNKICDYQSKFKVVSKCVSGKDPKVILWGDSYAMALADGLVASDISFIQATRSNCGPNMVFAPFPDKGVFNAEWTRRCLGFARDIFKYLAENKQITTVVMSSPFVQYLDGEVYDGDIFLAPSFDDTLASFVKTVDLVRSLGKHLVIIAPPPRGYGETSKCLKRKAAGLLVIGAHGTKPNCSFTKESYKKNQNPVITLLKTINAKTGVPIVWIDQFTCKEGRCRASLDDIPLYRAGGHLTKEGSAYLFSHYSLLPMYVQ